MTIAKTTSSVATLFAGLLAVLLGGACGGSGDNASLSFQSPKDGDTFCTKDDVNVATPAIDVRVEVKGIGVAEGTQVVLENDSTNTSDTQPIVGGVATFTVALAAGNNRLVAHTPDNKVVALPPITVAANTGAPAITITKPLDGAVLGAAQDADHDLTDGFQYDVEVRAEVEDGQEVELYVGGVLQPKATVSSKKAVFTAVTLPSTVGSATLALEAKVSNTCGNQGTDTANIQVLTGQPSCAIQGFNPAAVVIPSPGPGTVLNISTDGDTATAGMQTSLLVQVTPAAGTSSGLSVEIFYGSGAAPKATGTTSATGAATIPLSLPEGTLTISARCWDAAGNPGVSQDQAVLVDTVAPDCAITLAGNDGVKASGLFNPGDDVDTGTGGVQITGTLTSAATDVVGQPVTFALNGTPAVGTPTVDAGGTASKNLTITAGDQAVSATVADRAQNTCTVEQQATLDDAGCAVNFTNLTSASVLNIASDSSGSTGLQYGVTLDVDAACAGQTLTLTSSKGGSVQQAVPNGTGTVAMTFANYTVCSGSCQQQVTLTATLADAAGNVTVKTVTVLADNVAPGANITVSNPASASCGSTVTPSQDVDSNAGNGVQVDVLVAAPTDRTSLSVDVTNAGGTTTFTPSPPTSNIVRITLASGSNNIVAHVVSATGNPGATSPACAISLQDLAVSFTSPISGAVLGRAAGTVSGSNLLVTITGTVSAVGATVTLAVDGGSSIATSMVGTTWTATSVPLAEGTRSIRADATASGGRTGNASISTLVDITVPELVTALTANALNRASIRVTFSDPPNSASGSGLKHFLVGYSTTVAVSDANFNNPAVTTVLAPLIPSGTGSELLTLTGLYAGRSYQFGVVAVDNANNSSLVAATSSATSLVFTPSDYTMPAIGNTAGNPVFGRWVAAGYLNSDTYPDLVIGAPFTSFGGTYPSGNSREGVVLVYLGTAAGFNSSPDYVIRGPTGSRLGLAGAMLKFFGSATDDLAIGAYAANGFSGTVYLCRGGSRFAVPATPPVVLDPTTCEVTIVRSGAGLHTLGFGVAATNFDGDAYEDLVISAPFTTVGANASVGEAFVIYGRAFPSPAVPTLTVPDDLGPASTYNGWSITFPAAAANSYYGNYVYRLRDVGGDTKEDIAVAGLDLDTAYVYYGRAPSASPVPLITPADSGVLALLGGAGSKLGTGMAGIGGKIVVGAPGSAAGAGRVYVVNGGGTGSLDLTTASSAQVPTVITGLAGEGLGAFVANPANVRLAGDLNGDGYADIWCSNAQTPWKAYLFYGGSSGFAAALATTDATWQFSPTGGSASSYLAILPDANADGLAEVGCGDWGAATTQTTTVLK